MISVKPLFDLGDIHIAEGVVKLFEENLDKIVELLEFHQMGYWGNICESDKKINKHHLRINRPILSCYNVRSSKVFVVTDLANKTTWVMRKTDILKEENIHGIARFRSRDAG